MQKIAIGSDHKGYAIKKTIIDYLQKVGISVIDVGPFNEKSVDYPDYAYKVSKMVANNEVSVGILICYTGIGMSIVANKVNGIRASLVGSVEDAILTREHNNSNVLCMGAKNITEKLALQIVKAYLNSSFTGERHCVRVDKITKIENQTYEER